MWILSVVFSNFGDQRVHIYRKVHYHNEFPQNMHTCYGVVRMSISLRPFQISEFLIRLFAILQSSLALMFIYCRYVIDIAFKRFPWLITPLFLNDVKTRVSKATGFPSFPWVLGCHVSDKAWFLSDATNRVCGGNRFTRARWTRW